MKFFRYSNNAYEGKSLPSRFHTSIDHVDVYLHEYDVVKETKCGVWIEVGFDLKRKFVNTTCVKQYAYKSLDDAKQNYIHRKHRQIEILSSQLKCAKASLAAIESNFTISPMDFNFLESCN